MTTRTDEDDGGGQSCCKLGRAVRRYDLQTLDDDIVGLWRGDGAEQVGVRDLADRANVAILDAALDHAGVTPLDGDVERLYDRLTDEDVGSGRRTELRSRLTSEGVDIDTVESQFVSHQTVHSHLRECLDIERATAVRSPAEWRAKERGRVQTLQSRTEAVTVDSIERLVRHDAVDVPEFDVFVDVSVLCRECGRQTEIGDLIDQGGCRCRVED